MSALIVSTHCLFDDGPRVTNPNFELQTSEFPNKKKSNTATCKMKIQKSIYNEKLKPGGQN